MFRMSKSNAGNENSVIFISSSAGELTTLFICLASLFSVMILNFDNTIYNYASSQIVFDLDNTGFIFILILTSQTFT